MNDRRSMRLALKHRQEVKRYGLMSTAKCRFPSSDRTNSGRISTGWEIYFKLDARVILR